MRIINPWAVISWFRPPVDRLLVANGSSLSLYLNCQICALHLPDLELYITWTDAFGLITLAAILLVVSDAVPIPGNLVGSSFSVPASEKGKKPYAKAIIALTIFHHVTTGIGSFQHWKVDSHRTVAMDIGVWGNVALTALGVVTLGWGMGEDVGEKKVIGSTPRKAR
jgi:hypothetical protein